MKRILIALIVIFAFACSDNDDEKLEYIENLPIPFLPDNSIAWGMSYEDVHAVLYEAGFAFTSISQDNNAPKDYDFYIKDTSFFCEARDSESGTRFYSKNNPNKTLILFNKTNMYYEIFGFEYLNNRLNRIIYYTSYLYYNCEAYQDTNGNYHYNKSVDNLTALKEDKIKPIATKLGKEKEFNQGILQWENIEPYNNIKITCYTKADKSDEFLYIFYASFRRYRTEQYFKPGYGLEYEVTFYSDFWALEFKPLN